MPPKITKNGGAQCYPCGVKAIYKYIKHKTPI